MRSGRPRKIEYFTSTTRLLPPDSSMLLCGNSNGCRMLFRLSALRSPYTIFAYDTSARLMKCSRDCTCICIYSHEKLEGRTNAGDEMQKSINSYKTLIEKNIISLLIVSFDIFQFACHLRERAREETLQVEDRHVSLTQTRSQRKKE